MDAFYNRLGLLRGQSEQAWNTSLGFDPRTVRAVTSRYTDYDIPATEIICTKRITLTHKANYPHYPHT